MRARPNLSSDQLVQNYLARVAAAARHLPKGARMAFVGRTKAQIERKVTAAGTNDPAKVAEILGTVGDPEELVRAERLRIDNKWLKKRGREEQPDKPPAAPASASTPKVYRPRTYQPRFHRALNSRWKPATPPPRRPDPGTPAAPADATAVPRRHGDHARRHVDRPPERLAPGERLWPRKRLWPRERVGPGNPQALRDPHALAGRLGRADASRPARRRGRRGSAVADTP